MMNLSKLLLVIGIIVILGSGCLQNQQIATNYHYQTECIDNGFDGIATIVSYGSGMNGKEAANQAIKNGIYDLLFSGARSNRIECNIKPIIPEVNAKDKYESYFNDFFKVGGKYLDFVKHGTSAKKITNNINRNSAARILYKTTFHLNISELKRELIEDQILFEKY
jgi:hypothetical protein